MRCNFITVDIDKPPPVFVWICTKEALHCRSCERQYDSCCQQGFHKDTMKNTSYTAEKDPESLHAQRHFWYGSPQENKLQK